MVKYCSAFNCKERFKRGGPVTFHSFPADPLRRKIWTRQVRRKNFTPSKCAKLCSKHFTPDCFETEKFGGTWLKSSAIPTIFDFTTVTPSSRKKALKKLPKKRGKKIKDAEEKKLRNENKPFGIGDRRVVDVNYFIRQLMVLNEHKPSGCSLNNMIIISETRRGIASELKFKCSKCNYEKCVWTEDVSTFSPVKYTATITELNNEFPVVDEFLDVLNIPSVSIDTERDTVTESNRNEIQKAIVKEKQLTVEQTDIDAEKFTAIVTGTRSKKTCKTSTSGKSLDKRPEIMLVSLQPDPNLLPRTVTLSDMTVEIDPKSLIMPDVDLPDLSMPELSSRTEPESSEMNQNLNQIITSEMNPTDPPQPDYLSKIKEEPIDRDTIEQDIFSTRVMHTLDSVSEKSCLKKSQQDSSSLFHPPVLIKEELMCFEEES